MSRDRFEKFSVYLECAGNSVPTVQTLIKFIDIIKKMNYDSLYIGTADTYEIEGEPYFGYNRGRYTVDELRLVDTHAKAAGIELIPSIQTLAHLNFLGQYIDYNDVMDCGNILLCDDENTYALIDRMFTAISKAYTSRTINIGMDEAFMLGLGKYRQKHGAANQEDIMLRHLNRVLEIASRHSFKCQMWSDMFFRIYNNGNYDNEGCGVPSKLREIVPEGLELIYWNYGNIGYDRLNKAIKSHFKISDNVTFAGGLWKWMGFIPDNEYSCMASKNAFKVCRDNGVKNYIITLWSDNGGEASLYSILPALYFCSKLNLDENCDLSNFDKSGFEELFGVRFDHFMLLDTVNKPIKKIYSQLNNKSYYYLYNDVFLGDFDSLITADTAEAFKRVADSIECVEFGEFNYIFETAAALARVLSIKADLGKRARQHYLNKNRLEILKIAQHEIPVLLKFLDSFIEKFTLQWERENKTFGFETHCIRLGGLKQRLEYAKARFLRYASGEIDTIDEYETRQLPFNYNNWSENLSEDDLVYTNYLQMATDGYF